jgi:hypothetical protein
MKKITINLRKLPLQCSERQTGLAGRPVIAARWAVPGFPIRFEGAELQETRWILLFFFGKRHERPSAEVIVLAAGSAR